METRAIQELIGYIASILVAASLTMTSVLRLRVVNLVGSAVFTVYGVLIQAWPIAAVNGFIVCINLWHLARLRRTREYFRLLEVQPDSEYLLAFLEFYRAEIERTLPGFRYDPTSAHTVVFILRDMVPAGIFIARPHSPGVLCAELDFAIPAYRDFRMGPFLYGRRADFFRARGIRRILTSPGAAHHRAYLARIGFAPDGEAWARDIPPPTNNLCA